MTFLSNGFLSEYKNKKVNWGFASGPNSIGEVTYRRTYSRDGEVWWETVQRVVEGTYNIIKEHCRHNHIPFKNELATLDAETMFDLIFNFKFLPPGRGLWAMGSSFIKERSTGMPLNNCAFASTEFLHEDPLAPFLFMFDVSMLGVGVGFDLKGAGQIAWNANFNNGKFNYVVEDSREGWVDSFKVQLEWALGIREDMPVFDYSLIRAAGEPIKTFGGVAPGAGPLINLHDKIFELVGVRNGDKFTSSDITDVMNLIGVAVVSGGVRRTAQIAFGESDDNEFLNIKNYQLHPERMDYGWASNNSLFMKVGDDYSQFSQRIIDNGEPGFLWLENAQNYGRMIESPNHKDYRAKGANPCNEQTLEHMEVCCLVETFPYHHETVEEFQKTLKYAYIYAKAVTLVPTHWKETNAVMLRNRRIGTSVSGVAQFVTYRGKRELIHWLSEGYKTVEKYDNIYSEWLCIRDSIKKTSVKPSGTTSLVVGATPGAHYPTDRYYLRRMRFVQGHPDLPAIEAAGYTVEKAIHEPNTMIVEFPVVGDEGVPVEKEVTIEDKMSIAVLLQKYWADNQVSCTVTFDPSSEGEKIAPLLSKYDSQLKGISFLPYPEQSSYVQIPYESITKEVYEARIKELKPIEWVKSTHDQSDMFCDGAACVINLK